MMMSALLCCNSNKASSLMRLIPSIHVVPNQLRGSLKKETLIPVHGMVSSAMKTQVVSSRLTSRVAASRVLSTLAAAFSHLSILSGLIFLLTTSMPDKSIFFDFFITLRLQIARKNSIFTWSLSSNKLSGELPTSIGYLDSSKELDISMNELSGQLPTSIRNLASLEEPQLPFNRFSRLCGRPLSKQRETSEAPTNEDHMEASEE
ncbi:hypothetical protein CUMW_232960 [Citrus unshiu]|uniref:Uncharacterized protein n=1 Tax=Citrus unshiu TaxID=55188 RepID=A0A2H5QIB3_CITUN|nr:hypothetical protein CUMW_232960 [Citrus unshiu]